MNLFFVIMDGRLKLKYENIVAFLLFLFLLIIAHLINFPGRNLAEAFLGPSMSIYTPILGEFQNEKETNRLINTLIISFILFLIICIYFCMRILLSNETPCFKIRGGERVRILLPICLAWVVSFGFFYMILGHKIPLFHNYPETKNLRGLVIDGQIIFIISSYASAGLLILIRAIRGGKFEVYK